MSNMSSKIVNFRHAIFIYNFNYIRNHSSKPVKPEIKTIINKKFNIYNIKFHSKYIPRINGFIYPTNNAKKKLFYLSFTIGNRQFFRAYCNGDRPNIKKKEPNSIDSNKIFQKVKEIQTRENIWTVPNYLTVSRLFVSPIIGYFILKNQYDLALIAFIYAGLTDSLDGFIARKYDMKTMLGTVMDPAADKVLMTIMTITLAMKNLLPTTVILGRDVGLILATFYYRYISLPSPKTMRRYFDMSIPSAEIKPTLISKVNTALQLALMGVTLASPVFEWKHTTILIALQYTVAGTTIWSGLSYVFSKDAVRILKPPIR